MEEQQVENAQKILRLDYKNTQLSNRYNRAKQVMEANGMVSLPPAAIGGSSSLPGRDQQQIVKAVVELSEKDNRFFPAPPQCTLVPRIN